MDIVLETNVPDIIFSIGNVFRTLATAESVRCQLNARRKGRVMRFRTITLPVIFALLLATSGFIVASRHKAIKKQGFTLYMAQTVFPADGRAPIPVSTAIRYQRSDGSWRKDTTYANGRAAIAFGLMGRGVFNVDAKAQRLDFLSRMTEHLVTEDSLRGEAGFVREEEILGLKTFLVHGTSTEAPDESTDSYICPAVQGYPMRIVSTSKGARTVYEVTKVVMGDPPESVFASLPDYPVDNEKMRH